MKPGLTGCLVGVLAGFTAGAVENPIRLNSIGSLPGQTKQASIALLGTNFPVRRVADGATVCSGAAVGPVANADTGGMVCLPTDNRLHAISLTKSGPVWKLGNDPVASKVIWKSSDGITP